MNRRIGDARLADGGDHTAGKSDQDQRRSGNREPVTAEEFPGTIATGIGPRPHRITLGEPAQILGKLLGGLVAPPGFLAQRHQDDVGQIRIDGGTQRQGIFPANRFRQFHLTGGRTVGARNGHQFV